MESFATFLDMGGYATFVWPAFGLTALGMAGLLAATLRQLGRRQRELSRLEANGAPGSQTQT